MLLGVLFALLASLMWGLIFVAPLLVDGYPSALLASGRYLAFGLIVLPFAWRPSRPAIGARHSPSLWWGTSSTTFACRGPSCASARRWRP